MFRPNKNISEREGTDDRGDENNESARLLRQGLHSLPVPEASADFDARVHAALRQPIPWWRTLRTGVRPLLSGMACSLLITLAFLRCLTGTLTPISQPTKPSGDTLALDHHRERQQAAEWSVEQADLSDASLRGLSAFPHTFTPMTLIRPTSRRHF